jgi:D-alanyl-D-alanine carboxypeptidase
MTSNPTNQQPSNRISHQPSNRISNKLHRLTIVLLSLGVICTACRGRNAIETPLERGISTRVQNWAASSLESGQQKKPLFSSDVQNQLQSTLEAYGKSAKLPGTVLAIASSQQTWMTAIGQANVAAQTVMQPTDRFRIGPISEMFIAVVCLQLDEEGVLSLGDRITNWLPAEIAQQIPESDRITIRQLLNHTSGLPELNSEIFQQAVAANPGYRWTAQERLAVGFEGETIPRGSFSASAANYLLLELILERATGSSLTEALQDRILKPLNLKNTFVELSTQQTLTPGYQDWNQDGSLEDVTQPLINTGLGLGGTALVSNGPDLIQFSQALFFKDELLTVNSQQKMLSLIETRNGGYGLGITHTMTRWGEIWGQAGHTTGFSAALFYLPVHDLTIVTWTNRTEEKKYQAIELADKSLGIILGKSPRFSQRITTRW